MDHRGLETASGVAHEFPHDVGAIIQNRLDHHRRRYYGRVLVAAHFRNIAFFSQGDYPSQVLFARLVLPEGVLVRARHAAQ